MPLTVYQMPHSPYCIPITQALTACGVAFEIVNVNPATREEVIVTSHGRYYQVPLLVDGGRLVMESSGDSLDVARHVDATHAGGRLFPPAAEAANFALTRFIENELEGIGFKLGDPAFTDSIADTPTRVLLIRHKERKFGAGCVEQWRAGHDALARDFDGLLESFECTLALQPFLLGDAPVYADFALFGVLANATWHGPFEIPASRPAILAWKDRLAAFRFLKIPGGD